MRYQYSHVKVWGDSICTPLHIFLKCVYEIVKSCWNEKFLFFFIRETINKLLRSIICFHFYLFVGKYFDALFSKNNILSSNQSGNRTRDSLLNEHVSINHEILSAFDMGLKVSGIFLDISKAFTKHGMRDRFLSGVSVIFEWCLHWNG